MEAEQAPERSIPCIMKHQDLGKSPDGKFLVTEFIFDDESVLTVDFRLQKTHKGSRQMKARYVNDIKALVAYGLPADALDKFIIAREMVERRAIPKVNDEIIITAENNPIWKKGQVAIVMEVCEGECVKAPLSPIDDLTFKEVTDEKV